jgi:hypothetical protein
MNPSITIGAKARIANPALKPLEFLIGEWRTTGTHPAVPGRKLEGRASFAWHQGGAFIVLHTHVDEPDFPDGVAIFGSDDDHGTVTMIYFDEREISRRYEVTVGDKTVTWKRDDAKLAQTNTISANGDDILVGKGRKAENGGEWGDDLSQTFHRDTLSWTHLPGAEP